MTEIFLIQQIWIDPMENEVCGAVGYAPIGWVNTEKEAKDIVNKGKTYTKSDCWAIRRPMPEFIYKKLVKHET